MSYEREQALGQLTMFKNRLKKIHIKAGQLMGKAYQELDQIIGEDFMEKDFDLVLVNVRELVRLQTEAKAIASKIDVIQNKYNFDDLDLD